MAYSMWVFVTGFFYFTGFWGLYLLELYFISFYCSIFYCMNISHELINIWVVSTFLVLINNAAMKFVHKAFWGHMLSLLLSKHLGVWSHTVTLCWKNFSSITQSYPTLCDPMDHSTPGLPVHHQLLEFTQTWAGDAIQPSHPLSFPSPPALNLAQHQGLFKWVSSSHQVAKVLEFQPQHQSFQWISRLVSFMIDWFDLLAVQGTLKRLLQHHS